MSAWGALAQLLIVGSRIFTPSGSSYALGEQVQTFYHPAGVRQAVFSPDGKWMASGAVGGQAKIWSPDSGAQRFATAGGDTKRVGYSFDGSAVINVGTGGCSLWNPNTGNQVSYFNDNFVVDMAVSPTAPIVLVTNISRNLFGYSTVNGDLLLAFPAYDNASFGAFSPDGSKIISGGYNGTVILWDAATLTEIKRLPNSGHHAKCVGFTMDGAKVFVSTDDNLITFYNVDTSAVVMTITAPNRPMVYYRLSNDGTKLAGWGTAQGPDEIIPGYVWDLSSSSVVHNFSSPGAFSPDMNYFVSQTPDRNAVLLDAATFTTVHNFALAGNGVGESAFAPDSARLAICSGTP